MPKRKAKFAVNTNRTSRINGDGEFVNNFEAAPYMSEVEEDLRHLIVGKPNPRIKTKRPRRFSYYDASEEKTINMNWIFTTEGNAKRFVKNKRKQLSQKYKNHSLSNNGIFEYWWG